MFEDSLVESRVAHLAPAKRWTAIASITFQCSVAALLAIIPLLHPERLALRIDAPPILMPFVPKPVKIEPKQISTATSSTALSIPSTTQTESYPTLFHPGNQAPSDEPPSTSPINLGMNSGIPDAFRTGGDGHGTRVTEAPAHPPAGRLHVSSGVSAGLLATPIRPVYPAIAKAAGVQGAVVVEAIISRTGTIESLRVVSGPAMLQQAAMEAIRAARYQPYRLNDEPIEVETMITVNFRMGG